ncbi:MAG: NfeD family protein [bacterium]|nr:NfeD family protein [bacterium]
MFWIWMAAAVVFLIIELFTPTLIFVSFAIAAAAAGVYAQLNPLEYYWQIGIFIIVTIVLLPLSRKAAKKLIKPSDDSNVDAMIGKTALVTAAIDPDNGGKVRFEGEIWQAMAEEAIEENAKVRIIAVTGTRVRVQRAV